MTAPLDRPYAADEAIVQIAAGTDLGDYLALLRAAGVTSVEALGGGTELWRLGASFEMAYEAIGTDSAFDIFQPNYTITLADFTVTGSAGGEPAAERFPNDPSFGSTYGMARINAPAAWDITTGGAVKVAVIDTGVDYTHPDLAANMWVNPGEALNGIDDDGNGFVDDIRGWDFVNNDNNPADDHNHGTHVSGTIAAVGNNGIGVAGVAWSGQIMPIKFLSAAGTGSTDNAIKAVNYAAMIGAKVINASWGGAGFNAALQNAIANSNALFVAAAGNGGFDGIGDNNDFIPHYPSSYTSANIISVAATDINDNRANFSNFGASSVDLGAADFNADAKADLLLHNDSGEIRVLTMNGAQVVANDSVGVNAPSWHIVGTGDHNADGRADLTLHNDSGEVRLLTMNGAQVLSNGLVGTTELQWQVPPPHFDLI
jgi:subtilisin family serine protease